MTMRVGRWVLVLLSVVCLVAVISVGEAISLHFSGHLTAGQGTCEQISESQIHCQVPAGGSATLALKATVSPATHVVAIGAAALPPWVQFDPVSGHGSASTEARILPPASAAGYTVTLVFTATTAAGLVVDLEVGLTITGTQLPGEEEPDYTVPGGEETDQGIEFDVPFLPDFSTFVLGEVTNCETGAEIDPSALSTEFVFAERAAPPYELTELEKVVVHAPGYLPREVTEFQPITLSLFFVRIKLLTPVEASICLEPIGAPHLAAVSPMGACVGNATSSVSLSVTTFRWEATGLFTSFEVIVYDNPCGQYPPPPPTTPTPPPSGVPTPSPAPTPPSAQPVLTTAGVWEPLWDRLTPAQREALAGRGLSGWGWVKAARELLGEDEEVPVEGLIQETEGVLLPDTQVLGRFGEIPAGERSIELPLDWILEPGQAFIWQVLGVYEDAQGETGALLSPPQCVRYQPTVADTGGPAEPIPCVPPECNIRVELKDSPAMDGGLDPVSETMTIDRDGFVPLKAVGLDFDQLWWHCEPCPYCPEPGSSRMNILTGKVRFEWDIQQGDGDFVEVGCSTPVKQDVGDRVIFMPPYVEKGQAKTTKILLEIVDDNLSQPIDRTVRRWVTIETKRDGDSGNPDVYRITITSDAYTLPSPVQVTPNLEECRAEPADWKTPCEDLVAEILTPADDIIAEKEWVRLEAIDLADPDPVDLFCSSIRCIPDATSRCFNDDIRWTWTIVRGGGRFVKGNVGRFVLYEAPERETEVEIEVRVDNPYGFQCTDTVPPADRITLRIVKPGIRMELTPSDWLPMGGAAGNTVAKRSYLVYKDGEQWVAARPHMCRIHKFELIDTTSERGFCLNGGEHNDTSLDLWIPEGAGHECSNERPFVGRAEKFYQKAETKRPVREYTLAVECEDYGAWAFVRSTANAPYESVPWKRGDVPQVVESFSITATFGLVPTTSPGLSREQADNRVTIPFDADENRIADATRHNDRGRAADRDPDDQPAGEGPGDGLSNYEEYRGFLIKGAHTRTDIRRKDLFVHDQNNLTLGLFPDASRLQCHLIDPDEYNGDGVRQVNFNRGYASRCAQHGLHLANARLGAGSLGYTPGCQTNSRTVLDDSTPIGPPKYVLQVRVDRDQHFRLENVPVGFGVVLPTVRQVEDLAATIAHELGHAVSMEHHGNADAALVSVLSRAGTELRLLVIAAGGVTSGREDCLIRYNYSDYWWRDPAGTEILRWPAGSGTIRLTFEADGRPVSVFCDSAAGTGVNAGGRAGGNATRGDCLGQIHVSDE